MNAANYVKNQRRSLSRRHFTIIFFANTMYNVPSRKMVYTEVYLDSKCAVIILIIR